MIFILRNYCENISELIRIVARLISSIELAFKAKPLQIGITIINVESHVKLPPIRDQTEFKLDILTNLNLEKMLLSTDYRRVFILHKLQLEYMSIVVIWKELLVKRPMPGNLPKIISRIRSPANM